MRTFEFKRKIMGIFGIFSEITVSCPLRPLWSHTRHREEKENVTKTDNGLLSWLHESFTITHKHLLCNNLILRLVATINHKYNDRLLAFMIYVAKFLWAGGMSNPCRKTPSVPQSPVIPLPIRTTPPTQYSTKPLLTHKHTPVSCVVSDTDTQTKVSFTTCRGNKPLLKSFPIDPVLCSLTHDCPH